ncbi:MAG: hypothetical protein KDE47_13000, partial [Caldilineaceae bacterium]|nr:hypothetical protein [Caldilineaceae bacterium]
NSTTLSNLIDTTGDPVVGSMAVDSANLYWHEHRLASGGPIRRASTTGGGAVSITDNLGSLSSLSSTGRYLFWLQGEDIFRLATDAPAIALDLVGDEMAPEVVQVTQNPAHTVPLVAGKSTFVRSFARIANSSEGFTEIPLWPPVVLHGSRDGVRLPDSPLRPLNYTPIRTNAADRTTLNGSFLFQLPASWSEGTVTLRAEVNPMHTLAETAYANNSAQRTVTFQPTQGICLDFLPVLTASGVSRGASNNSSQLHIARAKAMLPLSQLGGVFRGGSIRTKPVTGEPYNMAEADDRNELMFHLTVELMFSTPPPHCSGRRTIRTVMVPSAARFGLSNGVAPIIYFLENFGGPPVNYPQGGNAGLAHELGHQFGRAHVACPVSGPNAPANTDSGYIYNSCRIDDTNTHIGFDSITRQLIVPLDTPIPTDVMSYGSAPNWLSDYTYRGIFNNVRLSTNRSAAEAGSGQQDTSMLFVGGF